MTRGCCVAPGGSAQALARLCPRPRGAGVLAAWDLRAVCRRPECRTRTGGQPDGGVVVWRYAGLLIVPAGQALVHQVHWVTSARGSHRAFALGASPGPSSGRRAPHRAGGRVRRDSGFSPRSCPLDVRAAARCDVGAQDLRGGHGPLSSPRRRCLPGRSDQPRRSRGSGLRPRVLTMLTHARNRVWADPLDCGRSPCSGPRRVEAHLGYAESLREIGQCERAIPGTRRRCGSMPITRPRRPVSRVAARCERAQRASHAHGARRRSGARESV